MFANPVYADGSSGAPSGTAQLPTLLNGYAARAPWKVAGVDYYVGIDRNAYPSDASLKDPSTSPPSGTSWSSPYLTVTADNVTIDGYNFNNCAIILTAHANTTITNCKFTVGAGGFSPIYGAGGGQFPTGTVTIKNCEFFGNNIALTDHGGVGAITVSSSTGTNVVIEYCFVNESFSDWFDFGNIGNLTIDFNCIQDGFNGAHADFIQGGGCTGGTVSFNTITMSVGQGQNINGLIALGAQGGSTIENVNVENNTVLAPGTINGSGGALFAVNEAIPGSTTQNITVLNNYYDASGSGNAVIFVPNGSTDTWGTNIQMGSFVNMNTGGFATIPTSPTPAPTHIGN